MAKVQNQQGIQKNDTVAIYHWANPTTLEDSWEGRVGGMHLATVTHITKYQYTADGIRFWNTGIPVTPPNEAQPTVTDDQGRVAYVAAAHPGAPCFGYLTFDQLVAMI